MSLSNSNPRRNLPKIRRLPPINLSKLSESSQNSFDKSKDDDESKETCVICLEKIENDDFMKSKCKHNFCASCILTNVANGNNKCPLCRYDLCKPIDLTPNLNMDTGFYIVETALRKTN